MTSPIPLQWDKKISHAKRWDDIPMQCIFFLFRNVMFCFTLWYAKLWFNLILGSFDSPFNFLTFIVVLCILCRLFTSRVVSQTWFLDLFSDTRAILLPLLISRFQFHWCCVAAFSVGFSPVAWSAKLGQAVSWWDIGQLVRYWSGRQLVRYWSGRQLVRYWSAMDIFVSWSLTLEKKSTLKTFHASSST